MNKLKKKPVDYSGFSLRRLNEPRFSHIKLLGGWIFYFVMYFITENLIPREACHPIHCALDDMIPFNEFFLIFYVGWYAFVFGALAYTFFYDVENFRKLQIYHRYPGHRHDLLCALSQSSRYAAGSLRAGKRAHGADGVYLFL